MINTKTLMEMFGISGLPQGFATNNAQGPVMPSQGLLSAPLGDVQFGGAQPAPMASMSQFPQGLLGGPAEAEQMTEEDAMRLAGMFSGEPQQFPPSGGLMQPRPYQAPLWNYMQYQRRKPI